MTALGYLSCAFLGFALGRIIGGFRACDRCNMEALKTEGELRREIAELKWHATVDERDHAEYQRYLVETAAQAIQRSQRLRDSLWQGVN